MNGLILHDNISFFGGGERVVTSLSKSLDFPVYTQAVSVDADYLNELKIHTISFSKSPIEKFLSKLSENYNLYSSFKKITTGFSGEYDFVVFSGDFSLFAADKFDCPKILYCHTPPRLIYDLRSKIISRETNIIRKALLYLNAKFFEKKYSQYIKKMDFIVANSRNIENRLEKYLGVNADSVIYPPVETGLFNYISDGDYFLSTARLEPAKRIETIVEAFKQMPDKKLVIISSGSLEDYVKESAENNDNITYKGWVNDNEKAQLLGSCRALIYIPMDEDFGISPLEAMAAGKGVIAAEEGGLKETVIHDRTGVFVNNPCNTENLIKTVTSFENKEFNIESELCIKQAEEFSEESFIRNFKNFLEEYL